MEFAEVAGQDEETRVSSVSKIIDKAISSNSCLVTIYGRELGKQYSLENPEITIGRGADNAIVLDMDNVSRMHARVVQKSDGIFLEDLNSTNGTYVNDVEVKFERLRNGDLIKIGGAILKFLSGGNIESLFHEEIYRMTIVDGLTQVHNKRYFMEFLDREMARCSRYDRPLSLLLFDIDKFKGINDLHGHLAGDHILKRLAEIVAKHVRKEEAFARYGGEEFAILLRGVPLAGAARAAERLRIAIAELVFVGDPPLSVSISIGCASIACMQDATSGALIHIADQRLYEAKQAGRGRVVAEGFFARD
jgi:diguanylate cyclase (GGDEF)-like protein